MNVLEFQDEDGTKGEVDEKRKGKEVSGKYRKKKKYIKKCREIEGNKLIKKVEQNKEMIERNKE